ncbi:MAG: HPF/RaiA family ribosome-associated protein [Piscinibacter sp.]|uniref:HPF/RaiA family ribosome-associated protein n=1 Tax=Piscinibacter sp. TaxID=1903157 RepID=UPI00258813FF|nr:HPF/RaiA family ribosome-associated protein [Piscinibacter sp.]MCW5666388.1 HPF/RaiA family ribosome-associated protein [Piscinibacter sp.]
MIVDIHGQGFTVTPALAEHLRRRLGFVLTRHGNRIQRVAIRVGDENGPRGGVDKYCRIQVHLVDAPVAVITDVGTELYAVIDRAADRVGRVVVKHLNRTHPVRDVARHGARPVRTRRESQPSGRAQGDLA